MALAISQTLTYASSASNTTGTTTSSFSANSGDILVVLCIAESALTWTAPTSSGLTFTSRVSDNTASTCSMQLWTAPVTSTGSRTVTMGATGTARWHSAVCWVVSGGQLAGTPATMDVRGTGAPTGTLTTTAAGSLILWGNGDFAAVAPGTPAYRSGATQDFLHDKTTTFYAGYFAHQTAGAAGAQTVGQTAPTGQTYKLVGIEIQDAGGGSSFSGSLGLSGSGTLSLAGTPGETGAVALSGGGTLTTSAVPAIPGTLSLSGAGTLTGAGKPAFAGSVALSGSGSLTLVGSVAYAGSATLSGSGTLTLAGTPSPTGQLALSGSGTLTASGTPGGGGPPAYSGLVMLTGAGTLTANGSPTFATTVALGGTGVLTLTSGGTTVYRFDPPGTEQSMDPTGKDFLWSKVRFVRGDAVIRYRDGSFRRVQVHDPDSPDIDKIYLGGHVHTISDADAVLLIQAGYGEYLTVVPG